MSDHDSASREPLKMQLEWDVPAQGAFPDLSGFFVLAWSDGRYVPGAGVLADGLIIPLFVDRQSAAATAADLPDDPRGTAPCPQVLGDAFSAMRKAASEGAAGFQLLVDAQEPSCQSSLSLTQGRFVFPFLIQTEEAGGQWPTVLGSALLCDGGMYLTRRGPKQFGSATLRQWRRWDVMDRASAELAGSHPFRSHEPGQSFWCLSGAPGAVQFQTKGTHCVTNDPAVVLFARDNALWPFTPPEGYYPVFVSEESASQFLRERQGGAFHILRLVESEGGLTLHSGVMVQDLGLGAHLAVELIEVTNLPLHLAQVQRTFNLPPYMKFVVNPNGHREDIAWGVLDQGGGGSLSIKSVGGHWTLGAEHACQRVEPADQFDGKDSFYLGPSEFLYTEIGRSLAPMARTLHGEDLSTCSQTEIQALLAELIDSDDDTGFGWAEDTSEPVEPTIPTKRDLIIAQLPREGWTVEAPYGDEQGIPSDADAPNEPFDHHDYGGNEPDPEHLKEALKNCRSWALRYWETVDGDKEDIRFFGSPFELVRALRQLEAEDRAARVCGVRGYSSIGFEGSGSPELEEATGRSYRATLLSIAQSIAELGYRPSHGLHLMALSNSVLRAFRVVICGSPADMLVSHVPTRSRSWSDLYNELGLNPALAEPVKETLVSGTDPEAEHLLAGLLNQQQIDTLLPRTRLFLSTALLQLRVFGSSPCVDYAPVSVQVVKGLEYELRELMRECVIGLPENRLTGDLSREAKTVVSIQANQRKEVDLGTITHLLKAVRRANSTPFEYLAGRLRTLGVDFLTERKTTELILGPVLNRYRNGGAHESAVDRETCQECVEKLIGNQTNPGLIVRVARWRVAEA